MYGIDITKEIQEQFLLAGLSCKVYRDSNKGLITFKGSSRGVVSIKRNTGYTLTFHNGERATVRLQGVYIADLPWGSLAQKLGQQQISAALHNLLNT